MLYHLIHEVWHTKESAAAKNGKVSFRGFLGEYEAKIIAGGKEKTVHFNLTEGENVVRIKL